MSKPYIAMIHMGDHLPAPWDTTLLRVWNGEDYDRHLPKGEMVDPHQAFAVCQMNILGEKVGEKAWRVPGMTLGDVAMGGVVDAAVDLLLACGKVEASNVLRELRFVWAKAKRQSSSEPQP